jgi:hypothetical protein
MSFGLKGLIMTAPHTHIYVSLLPTGTDRVEINPVFCSRLYIEFTDEDAANVGYNGTTFHQIFGGK